MRVDTGMCKDKKLLQSIIRGFRINVFHVQCKLYFLNSLLREEKDLFASLSSKKRLYYLLNKG